MPNGIQERINQEVVDAKFAEMTSYLTSKEDEWLHSYYDARNFVNELYDTYTPNISKRQRFIGTLLGAGALAYAEILYGKDEYSPKMYSGQFEQNVIAMYHHGTHPRDMLEGMFEYATIINSFRPGYYNNEAFGRFPLIAGFHDLIMGNKRGNDEDQSRLLAVDMMRGMGYIILPPEPGEEPVCDGIDATKWDAEKNRQLIVRGQPNMKYRRAAGVGDLITLLKPNGTYKGICIGIEDNTKKMHDQVLTRVANERGFNLEGKSLHEVAEFYGASDELKARFVKNVLGQIGVLKSIRLADYRLNRSTTDERFEAFAPLLQQRRANVKVNQEIHQALTSPQPISPLDAVNTAQAYMLG